MAAAILNEGGSAKLPSTQMQTIIVGIVLAESGNFIQWMFSNHK
jgi:hypothetical protein